VKSGRLEVEAEHDDDETLGHDSPAEDSTD
jgi:hypothetical protein